MLFVRGVRSKSRRLSGTQSEGEGARRARFRGRERASGVDVVADADSGDAMASSDALRFRAGRRVALGVVLAASDPAFASDESLVEIGDEGVELSARMVYVNAH